LLAKEVGGSTINFEFIPKRAEKRITKYKFCKTFVTKLRIIKVAKADNATRNET
jgi:hypothetical protein